MTILKKLAKVKNNNLTIKKDYSVNTTKITPPVLPTGTKSAMPPKVVTTKTSATGKKTGLFAPKTTPSSPVKTVTPVQKSTPIVATTDVQNGEEVIIVTEDDEVTLTKDYSGNLFQDTYCENELSND